MSSAVLTSHRAGVAGVAVSVLATSLWGWGASVPAVAAEPDEALIVVANGDASGLVKVFEGDGDPVNPDGFDTAFGTSSDVAAGNFVGTRDRLELAVVDGGGRVDVFDLTDGDPVEEIDFDTTFDVGDLVAPGDVDDDGVDELVVANDETGAIDVFDVAGEGPKASFGIAETTFDNHEHNSFAVADVDDDGKADVLVANKQGDPGGRVDVLDPDTGQNKPSYGVPDTHFGDDDSDEFAAGDVDGDGDAEALVANFDNGEIDVHDTDTGAEVPGGAGDTNFDDSSQNQFKVGDVDGDGRVEGLVANGGGSPIAVGSVHVIDLATGLGKDDFGVSQAGFGEQDIMAVSTVARGDGGSEPDGPDFDGDGIPDQVEIDGIQDGDGDVVLDLADHGASPCRKDIVVEIDYMGDSGGTEDAHSHEPRFEELDDGTKRYGTLDLVTSAFNTKAVPALGGCPYADATVKPGINLINIVSDEIPHDDDVEVDADEGDRSEIDALKAEHLDSSADDYEKYVHYSLWLHDLTRDGSRIDAGGKASMSDSDFQDDQDFALTDDATHGQSANFSDQARAHMHELGHVIGLRHGGDVNVNCKPNYLSIMNYTYANTGLIGQDNSRPMDFSDESLAALDEDELVEEGGVGSAHPFITTWADPEGDVQRGDADGPLDWNGDGDGGTGGDDDVEANLNVGLRDKDDNPVKCEVDNRAGDDLTGHDDWAELRKDLDPVPFSKDSTDTGDEEPTAAAVAAAKSMWDHATYPDVAVQVQPALAGHRGQVMSLAVDERHVYAVHSYRSLSTPPAPDKPGTLVVLDRHSLQVRKVIPLGQRPRAVAVNHATGRVYVASGTPSGTPNRTLVTVVDGTSLATLAAVELTTTQAVADLAVSSRTNRVYLSNTSQGRLHVLDGATNAVLPDIAVGPGPVGLAVDETSDIVYVAQNRRQPGEPFVAALGRVLDDGVNPPAVLPRVDLQAATTMPSDVAVGAGQQVYVGSFGGGTVPPSVIRVDTQTRQAAGRLRVPGPARALAVNPDSGLTLVATDRGLTTVDATALSIARRVEEVGVLFSVATGSGATRDLFVGDAIHGRVTRLSYSSGQVP